MTTLTIGTPVSAPITPGLDDDNVWPTHIAKYGAGGFEIVEDDAALGDITDDRKEDKVVYVKSHGVDAEPALLFWDKANTRWADLDLSTVVNPTAQPGLEIDDGTNNAASVEKITLKGIKITNDDTPREVELSSGLNWHMMSPNQQYGTSLATEVIIEPPLNTYLDPDAVDSEAVRLGIKQGTFEPLQPPTFLAYLSETEEILGKSNSPQGHRDGSLWFDNVIVPAGSYIETNKAGKAYGLQEADELDPNVSGGTDYLVIFRAALKGVAPDDGYVRAYLHEKAYNNFQESKILKDVNGHFMSYEKHYHKGDKLGVVEVAGVVNAKGLDDFTCHVVDDFVDDVLNLEDRTEGGTCLMIQAITSEGKTGNGLQQFELDTGQNVEFSSHYLGVDRMNLNWITQQDMPVKLGAAGTGKTMTDGFHFYNISAMKMGVTEGHLFFQDNGVDVCDFNFGKIFSAEETQMMRGKEVDLTVTLTDQHDGYNVALMKWMGKPDEYTSEIYKTRTNDTPNFQTNWSKVDEKGISEDITQGDHSIVKTFTVPSDAINYAVIIYPVTAQTPMELRLKQFKLDVANPFIGYSLKAPELASEQGLYHSTRVKKLVQDTHSFASLRYTLNNAPDGLPMPVGELSKGNASITLDPSLNVISGSGAGGGEGAIVFGEDGVVTIDTELLLWNEQSTDSVVNFWYATIGPGNQLSKIADSEMQVTVKANSTGIQYSMPSFGLQVETGEKIVLLGKADKADGAYLKCVSDNKPLLSTTITFEEFLGSNVVSDDPFADIDLSQFDKVYTGVMTATKVVSNTSSSTFQLDIPSNMNVSVMQAVKELEDLSVRPVKHLDWVYNNSTNTLTVSFGELVGLGAITIGVYV